MAKFTCPPRWTAVLREVVAAGGVQSAADNRRRVGMMRKELYSGLLADAAAAGLIRVTPASLSVTRAGVLTLVTGEYDGAWAVSEPGEEEFAVAINAFVVGLTKVAVRLTASFSYVTSTRIGIDVKRG